jgi:hypothetical protein
MKANVKPVIKAALAVLPVMIIIAVAPPATGADKARPVHITAQAELGAGDDVAAALAKDWEDRYEVLVGKAREKRQISSCLQYLAVFEANGDVDTVTPGDQRSFLSLAAHCQALGMLRAARPAQRTYLDRFALDQQAPDFLPSELRVDPSPARSQDARKGQTWRGADPKVKAKVLKADVLRGAGRGYVSRVFEYARGDFDGDGIEDLLIRTEGELNGGTYQDNGVFLLTRTAPDAPLKTLKRWRESY